MLKLRTFVCFAFCNSRTEWMLVFSIDTRGKMEFDASAVGVDLVGLLVVSDEVVRDDDRPREFEIRRIGRNNASRESLKSFPFDGALMGQLWGVEQFELVRTTAR